jgi:hypothetical protein
VLAIVQGTAKRPSAQQAANVSPVPRSNAAL